MANIVGYFAFILATMNAGNDQPTIIPDTQPCCNFIFIPFHSFVPSFLPISTQIYLPPNTTAGFDFDFGNASTTGQVILMITTPHISLT